MTQGKQNCVCGSCESGCCDGNDCGCCSCDVKDLSKKDLMTAKTALEKNLKEVNEALTKAK